MSQDPREQIPPDGFHELMASLGPAEDAEIERIIAEKSGTWRESDLRPDPDPFGRNWDWLELDPDEAGTESATM